MFIMKNFRYYRGYRITWDGPTTTGHWLIYDEDFNFLRSADNGELDNVIDELETEG